MKADKEALDSKVSISTFDNTFHMLDEGLREALQKMDDYMNEEMALKQALKQLSLDMAEKMDGQAFQALRSYLGTSKFVFFLGLQRCIFPRYDTYPDTVVTIRYVT